MEMVISNHFLRKDLVHHPIDSQPLVNGWQSYFTHIFFQPDWCFHFDPKDPPAITPTPRLPEASSNKLAYCCAHFGKGCEWIAPRHFSKTIHYGEVGFIGFMMKRHEPIWTMCGNVIFFWWDELKVFCFSLTYIEFLNETLWEVFFFDYFQKKWYPLIFQKKTWLPSIYGCFNWIMNPIFEQEMVVNSQTSISKDWFFGVDRFTS